MRNLLHVGRHLRILMLTKIYSVIAIVRLRLAGAKIGRNLNVYGWLNLDIHPSGTVVIGDNVRINSGFARNAVGSSQRFGLKVGKRGVMIIGDQSGVSNCIIVAMDHVSIGSNVLIGGGVNIYDTDFHPLVRNPTVGGKGAVAIVKTAPVVISDDCFIGSHSTVLKGTSIGRGSVIGACSLVSRDILGGEIWAGNPIRSIRKLECLLNDS